MKEVFGCGTGRLVALTVVVICSNYLAIRGKIQLSLSTKDRQLLPASPDFRPSARHSPHP
jgi:hypothetical protein